MTSLTQTYNILQHCRVQKRTIFNNAKKIPTVTTTYIKSNMCHIHTSIVSRHLSTRRNIKMLYIPPPHISISEDILPRLTHHTIAQLRTKKLSFLKSYLHKVYATSHPSPVGPFCNTHPHDTHHLFNCTHIRTTLLPLDLWTDPSKVMELRAGCTENLAGEPRAGGSDFPLAMVKGVVRQQQQQ